MKYHFRDILGTKFFKTDGTAIEADTFDAALGRAYSLSAEVDRGVYVCTSSETAGVPSFTEVVSVRACK